MNGNKINEILKKNQTESEACEPPMLYDTSTENNAIEKTPRQLMDNYFYELPDMKDDISNITEKMAKNRKHYVNELEKKAREEAIQNLAQLRKSQIKKSIEKSNGQDILELIKKRHAWKSTIHTFDDNLPRICKVNSCANPCFNDSDFCFNHYTQDPNNILFNECHKCHRTHLVNQWCPQ